MSESDLTLTALDDDVGIMDLEDRLRP